MSCHGAQFSFGLFREFEDTGLFTSVRRIGPVRHTRLISPDRMLVHRRVTPSSEFTGSTLGVKCLAQEHSFRLHCSENSKIVAYLPIYDALAAVRHTRLISPGTCTKTMHAVRKNYSRPKKRKISNVQASTFYTFDPK